MRIFNRRGQNIQSEQSGERTHLSGQIASLEGKIWFLNFLWNFCRLREEDRLLATSQFLPLAATAVLRKFSFSCLPPNFFNSVVKDYKKSALSIIYHPDLPSHLTYPPIYPKGSHSLKKRNFMNTFHKMVTPPPHTAFMKSLFWFFVAFLGAKHFWIRNMKSGWPLPPVCEKVS